MPSADQNFLRLGTRGSLLARTQSQLVADQLMAAHPGLVVELHVIKTTGDRITDKPLHELGGKGLFTKELEQALLANEVDFAVHSYKDVPVTQPLVKQANLVVAAVPVREDPRDVAVMRDPAKGPMPHKGVIGTSSLRRRSQILTACPDVRIEPLRGNIDTRIRKLREGQYDVIVLAMAGLRRANLYDPSFMTPTTLLPAPGQGALALQCRKDDERTRGFLRALHDPETALCVEVERAVVLALNGDCHSPIAALATVHGPAVFMDVPHVYLRVAVGGFDGAAPTLDAEARAPLTDTGRAVDEVMRTLSELGVRALLHPES